MHTGPIINYLSLVVLAGNNLCSMLDLMMHTLLKKLHVYISVLWFFQEGSKSFVSVSVTLVSTGLAFPS